MRYISNDKNLFMFLPVFYKWFSKLILYINQCLYFVDLVAGNYHQPPNKCVHVVIIIIAVYDFIKLAMSSVTFPNYHSWIFACIENLYFSTIREI